MLGTYRANRKFSPERNDLFVAKGDEIILLEQNGDMFKFDFTNENCSLKTLLHPEAHTLEVSVEELSDYFSKV